MVERSMRASRVHVLEFRLLIVYGVKMEVLLLE